MPPPLPETGASTYSVALFILVAFLLVTPFATWWLEAAPPWWVPYLGWALVIGLIALIAAYQRRHGV